ncbi:MAG: carboxypeptidase regulatory-like domain-containing protein [Planctomycetota bacterium JB042]
MKPALVLVPVLVLGAAAVWMLVGSGDAPVVSGPPVDAAPEAPAAPSSPSTGSPPAAAERPREVADVGPAEVRWTEEGDVADLPPESLLTSRLTVRVEDPDGRPLERAAVTLAAGFPGREEIPVPFVDFVAEEASDRRGEVAFRVPPVGVYTVAVEHPGFATGELGPVLPGDDVTVRLERGETARGVVTDAKSGVGVEGAIVRLERQSGTHEAETDGDGGFTLVDLAPGRYRMRASAAGYDVLVRDGVDVPDEEAAEIAIELAPGVRVSGVVVAAGTGEPIVGARVEVDGGGKNDRLPLPAPVLTGADGTFGFDEPLSRRGLRLLVTADGFAGERVGVKAKGGVDEWSAEVELRRGVAVSGRVVALGGAPVGGANVRWRGGHERGWIESEADADGRFEIVGLGAGDELRLVATDPARSFAPGTSERTIGDDEARVELDVVLTPGGRLDGEVSDADGLPAPRARVLVEGLDGETWRRLAQKPVLFTDDEGRFSLSGLPEANLELSAEHQGWTAPPVPVAIAPGGAHVVTLGLEQGAILEGLVVDTRGAPVDDALVTAYAVDDDFEMPVADVVGRALGERRAERERSRGGVSRRGSSRRRPPSAERVMRAATGGREARLTGFRALARTDAAGRFVLRGLFEDEALALVVRKSGHERRHEFGIEPSRGAVRVVLPALVSLTGQVVDARSRRPLGSFRVRAEPIGPVATDGSLGSVLDAPTVRQKNFRGDDGRFELSGLQAGAWSVTVASAQHRRSEPRRVELAAGLGGDVLLEAVPAATVAVTVKGEGGVPVPGLSVVLRPRGDGGRAKRRTTGKDGRAVFFDPAVGEHDLLAGPGRSPFLGPVPITVLDAERVTKDLVVPRLGALVVDVRSGSGFGIPRARVRVRGLESGVRRTVRADANGRVRIERLLAEPVRVRASAKGHAPLEQAVTVQSGASHDLTLHLVEQP